MKEPWAIALEICVSNPRDRGRILANAFPFADIEVFYDNGSLCTEVVVRDKRKVVPFTFGCHHEVISRKTYEASDLITQDGVYLIAFDLATELYKYFGGVCDDER